MSAFAHTVIEHVWIRLTDGARLSARLWLPEESAQPVPVVLEYIPYRKRDRYRAADSFWGKTLASHGIAFARVDIRGTGDSEGVMTDEYATPEIEDGVEVIGWLANQPWCSGAVGMRGISWGAINTLQIAARRPRALKAIMAIAGADDRYTDDAHYIGGVLAHTSFQWGTMFKGVMAGPPDPVIVGDRWEAMWRERLEATPAILARWISHPHADDYWMPGGVPLDYDAISVPAFLIAGWQDTYVNVIGRLLARLAVPRKALVGPWGHTYPYFAAPIGLDWTTEEVRWWTEWLRGEVTGIMDEPMLRAYMPYATARQAGAEPLPGRWVSEQRWPPATASDTQWFLNSDGLAGEAEAPGQLALTGEQVVGLTKPEWLDRLPIEQNHDDARSLTFDSAPLEAPVEVLGQPKLRAQVSADAEVATLAARLCEVTADGRSCLVSYGLLNLTHRDGHVVPTPLEPGTLYEVELPLGMIAHRFDAGSRIRVALSQSLWPLTWPAPRRFELAITTGASKLSLPVRPQEPDADEMPIGVVTRAGTMPDQYDPAAADAEGRIVIHNDSGPETLQIADVGTEVINQKTERSEIVEGDPGSSRWQQSSASTWRRGDWKCEVSAGYDLTSDARSFRVREWLVARHNDRTIFERRSDERIPRLLG